MSIWQYIYIYDVCYSWGWKSTMLFFLQCFTMMHAIFGVCAQPFFCFLMMVVVQALNDSLVVLSGAFYSPQHSIHSSWYWMLFVSLTWVNARGREPPCFAGTEKNFKMKDITFFFFFFPGKKIVISLFILRFWIISVILC